MHQLSIPDWAEKRGQSMRLSAALEPARTALIVVDMQNVYVAEGAAYSTQHARDIVPNVNSLALATRAAGGHIVFLRQTYTDDAPYALSYWQKQVAPKIAAVRNAVRHGTPAHDIYVGLDRQTSDAVIDKYRMSAFIRNSSTLDEHLVRLGVDTLIIVGVATNACCESTARDACMMGYRVFFISDATAALTDEEHNAALLNLRLIFADVRTTQEMLKAMP